LIDEFPTIPPIPKIVEALRTLRSKKVTVSLFCTSYADVKAVYGEALGEVINSNCSYKVILGETDPKSQEYFSKLVGMKNVPAVGISTNYDYGTGRAKGLGFKLNSSSQYAIPTHEWQTLEHAIVLHPYEGGYSRVYNLANFYQKRKPRLLDFYYIEEGTGNVKQLK
jgi:hypothetical protein